MLNAGLVLSRVSRGTCRLAHGRRHLYYRSPLLPQSISSALDYRMMSSGTRKGLDSDAVKRVRACLNTDSAGANDDSKNAAVNPGWDQLWWLTFRQDS